MFVEKYLQSLNTSDVRDDEWRKAHRGASPEGGEEHDRRID